MQQDPPEPGSKRVVIHSESSSSSTADPEQIQAVINAFKPEQPNPLDQVWKVLRVLVAAAAIIWLATRILERLGWALAPLASK